MVWHVAGYTVEENRGDGSELTPRVMCGVPGTTTFLPLKLCNAHSLQMGVDLVHQ
jgi:hypothetical protein